MLQHCKALHMQSTIYNIYQSVTDATAEAITKQTKQQYHHVNTCSDTTALGASARTQCKNPCQFVLASVKPKQAREPAPLATARPDLTQSRSGADQAFVDHVKQVRILQSSCNSLLVIQLLVDGSFCGVGTRGDIYVHLHVPKL